MKAVLNFILIVILACATINCSSQKTRSGHAQYDNGDSVIYNELIALDFETYKGVNVDSFFNNLGRRYSTYITTTLTPGYIDYVIFKFGDNVSIDIAVANLGQTKPLNFGYEFDIKVYKSKKIKWICFRYKGKCIKGCEEIRCE